jgi:hypothetical protein
MTEPVEKDAPFCQKTLLKNRLAAPFEQQWHGLNTHILSFHLKKTP